MIKVITEPVEIKGRTFNARVITIPYNAKTSTTFTGLLGADIRHIKAIKYLPDGMDKNTIWSGDIFKHLGMADINFPPLAMPKDAIIRYGEDIHIPNGMYIKIIMLKEEDKWILEKNIEKKSKKRRKTSFIYQAPTWLC